MQPDFNDLYYAEFKFPSNVQDAKLFYVILFTLKQISLQVNYILTCHLTVWQFHVCRPARQLPIHLTRTNHINIRLEVHFHFQKTRGLKG